MRRWSPLGLLAAFACASPQLPAADTGDHSITTPSGLVYEVIEEGTGPAASAGRLALIHEVARRTDGTVIADTWALNHPVRFLLGGNQVIDGLDEAVSGMRVGERRRLIVPPALGHRDAYPEDGSIAPTDTLLYDVVLLQLSDPG